MDTTLQDRETATTEMGIAIGEMDSINTVLDTLAGISTTHFTNAQDNIDAVVIDRTTP